jgi:UDP:flavonoid glycosyltransferase YjiC (YdhE family)
MSRILFAWQLGSNYGHLMTDMPIAEVLREQGHELSFVVPAAHAALATEVLSPAGFSFSTGPELHRAAQGEALASYAEILKATGFGDEVALGRLASRWTDLLRAERADVVVADHAPLAVLAARCAAIPSVLLGNGFTVPPLVESLPSIRPWERVPDARLRAAEALVLASVNAVGSRSGHAPLDHLSQLFDASPAAITTTWELDPYGPRAQAAYLGPVAGESRSAAVDWPGKETRRVFAYLRASMSGIAGILTALEQCDAHVVCAMPGASSDLERHFEGTRLKLVGHALPLAPLLADADAVVGYGGSGLISASLLAGVPMVLVPQNPEQYLGSMQVARLGAGILVGPRARPEEVVQALGSVLTANQYREAATGYAQAHRGHDPASAARRAAALIAAQDAESGA